MKKNFEIGQSNEVIKSGEIHDLHNLYDYVGIILRGNNRQLQILFTPNSGHCEGKLPISLCFEGIDYLEFSPNFGSKVISSLDEMGYKNSDDFDDEWLLSQEQATNDDHLFLRLDNDSFIRIHSEFATLIETKKLVLIK